MTIDLKIKANRQNGRMSTGPKTSAGRARSSRNALRHGLTLPVLIDPAVAQEVDELAAQIAGPDANATVQELAQNVAEAQIELRRVRAVRQHIVCAKWNNPDYDSPADVRRKMPIISRLVGKYWYRLKNERELHEFVISKPEGPHKLASILVGTKELLRSTPTNSVHCRGASSLFERWMRHE